MAEKVDLLKEWIKYKKAELKAKNERIKVESILVNLYGTNFPEKSKTFNEEEIGFSINIKKNIVYSFDQDAWMSIRTDIPESLRPEKIVFNLDVLGFEYLKASQNENEKEVYKKISDCVTMKENKPTITVEKK